MTPLPTLRQLQFFCALVRRRSFSRAAADCLVSQSTLSSAVKELEAVLRAPLVDRSTRAFALTPAGEEAARRGAEILGLAEDMARAAAGRRPLEGPFHLGVIPTIAPFFLPRATPALAAAYPNLRLYLREDLTAGLADRLAAGQLDAALIALPHDLPGIETAEVGADPFLLAAPRGHPLAARSAVAIDDLPRDGLLLLEDGHCLRQHALEACNLSDAAAAAFSATSLFTLIQMVKAGLGATLLPRMAVEAGLADDPGVAVIPFEPPAPSRRIGLAWRRGSSRRDEAAAIAETCARALAGA